MNYAIRPIASKIPPEAQPILILLAVPLLPFAFGLAAALLIVLGSLKVIEVAFNLTRDFVIGKPITISQTTVRVPEIQQVHQHAYQSSVSQQKFVQIKQTTHQTVEVHHHHHKTEQHLHLHATQGHAPTSYERSMQELTRDLPSPLPTVTQLGTPKK